MARIVRIHEYGDPSVLKIKDIEVPPPASGEVQIDVKSIGLNRAEVMFRTHAYLHAAHFPSCLGYEAAGIVVPENVIAVERPKNHHATLIRARSVVQVHPGPP